jgi:hypothetical protein
MKILFLDIDGVLNCDRDSEVVSDAETCIFFRLNLRKIDMIRKIITDTDCKVVLSSSWRNFQGGRETVEYWKIPILDVTPTKHACRGAEIQEWLENHPEVTEYCIVDDDGDMLDSQLRHFIQTTNEHGLTENLAYRITHILNHGARVL